MDIRPLSDRLAVSPQIDPSDAEAIRQAGYATVICNRPDAEVPPELSAEAVGAAMREAGLRFEVLPATRDTLGEIVQPQAAIVAGSAGPVLAYCASGTRSAMIWALGQAGRAPADEVLGTAAKVGYDLEGLRPMLEG